MAGRPRTCNAARVQRTDAAPRGARLSPRLGRHRDDRSAGARRAARQSSYRPGSAEQVDVTGAPPHATLAWSTAPVRPFSPGESTARRTAVSQRHPGRGYRVRQGRECLARADGLLEPPRTAEHEDLQPADPWKRLRLPDDPRRHQARDRRASAGRRRPIPDADRVRGIRLCRPGRRPTAGSRRSRTCSGSRSSTSTCAAPAARAARSTTSSRSRASTATTSSRRSPASRGCCTTRSG